MAFKLRSGNTTPFKQMGSSSAKPKKGLDEVKNGEGKLKKEMISKPVEKKKHFLDKINPVTKIKKFREEQARQKGEAEEDRIQKELNKKKHNWPKVNLPKEIKDKLPKKPRKDTLRGRTGFEFDVLDPIKTQIIKAETKLRDNVITRAGKKMIEQDKKNIKKVKDYFTKR